MRMMSDLSHDLVEEILCRVPITSVGAVRCTCKLWNTLSKTRVLCQSAHLYLGLMNHNICSMRFNLYEILKEDSNKEFCDLSAKPIGNNLLNQDKITDVVYCHGLLLCTTWNNNYSRSRLLVWNPYLGQTRWIPPRNDDDDTIVFYGLGYDKNKNHKILSIHNIGDGCYEVYDFNTNSWSSFDAIPNCETYAFSSTSFPGVSVSGSTYFLCTRVKEHFLVCFDYTSERFTQILSMPHKFMYDTSLSCVKEEKLAVSYTDDDKKVMEIWVTTKIEPSLVSWRKFLVVDMEQLNGIGFDFTLCDDKFLIDEEKKVAVLFILNGYSESRSTAAYIVGDKTCIKKVDFEKVVNPQESVCRSSSLVYPWPQSYYVPSLVQITERKMEDKKRKHKRRYKKRKRTNKRV